MRWNGLPQTLSDRTSGGDAEDPMDNVDEMDIMDAALPRSCSPCFAQGFRPATVVYRGEPAASLRTSCSMATAAWAWPVFVA